MCTMLGGNFNGFIRILLKCTMLLVSGQWVPLVIIYLFSQYLITREFLMQLLRRCSNEEMWQLSLFTDCWPIHGDVWLNCRTTWLSATRTISTSFLRSSSSTCFSSFVFFFFLVVCLLCWGSTSSTPASKRICYEEKEDRRINLLTHHIDRSSILLSTRTSRHIMIIARHLYEFGQVVK